MNIFTQLFNKTQDNTEVLEARIRQDLLRREAKVGKNVFGPVPKGRSRDFFRIDSSTWIWQERWKENGSTYIKNTKYLLRERDIVKSINNSAYQRVSLEEAKNLHDAIHVYAERVKKEIYSAVT